MYIHTHTRSHKSSFPLSLSNQTPNQASTATAANPLTSALAALSLHESGAPNVGPNTETPSSQPPIPVSAFETLGRGGRWRRVLHWDGQSRRGQTALSYASWKGACGGCVLLNVIAVDTDSTLTIFRGTIPHTNTESKQQGTKTSWRRSWRWGPTPTLPTAAGAQPCTCVHIYISPTYKSSMGVKFNRNAPTHPTFT